MTEVDAISPAPPDPALRTLAAPLSGFGTEATEAEVTLRLLGPRQRLRRASLAFGSGLLVALVTLPIPIVHLVVPWTALIAGSVLAVRGLRGGEIFERVMATCPYCHKRLRLGLAGSRLRLPRDLRCPACGQPLTLGAPPEE